ncbi:MAG: hypothetical protein JW910_09000 [Anaerolineae bacterium]|nr:hypothetical protein [Anaerolineae bacterium]
MSRASGPLEGGGVRRGVVLGIAVFFAYVIAAGLLWALGGALGLDNLIAFFLAACAGPALVTGALLVWVMSLPTERRQRLLGVAAPSPAEAEGADQGPTQ